MSTTRPSGSGASGPTRPRRRSASPTPAPSVLRDLTEFGGPAVAAGAFRLIDVLRLNERVRVGGNVVVSKIPGPPVPRYTAGRRIEAMYPMGPLAQGTGLNITLLSYVDTLGLAIVADRDLVPDIDHLVADLVSAFEELRASTVGS